MVVAVVVAVVTVEVVELELTELCVIDDTVDDVSVSVTVVTVVAVVEVVDSRQPCSADRRKKCSNPSAAGPVSNDPAMLLAQMHKGKPPRTDVV